MFIENNGDGCLSGALIFKIKKSIVHLGQLTFRKIRKRNK
jgi:hypothetical protein